jgi:hypothetical protein
MSNNPYDVGPNSYGPGDALKAPATALLVVAIVSLVILVLAFLFDIFLLATGMGAQVQARGISNETRLLVRMGWSILIICSNGVTVAGSLAMLRRSSKTLSMAGCVLAVIPCIGPCFLLGIPFGIWSMVAMARPEIKSSFRS